ncbi:MAG: hypothetical protein ACR2MS_07620 [Weeksellaceae bacterium]
MPQKVRHIISFLLAGLIVIINLAELGSWINHLENHEQHTEAIALEDHADCGTFGTHSHIEDQNHKELCKGHLLNFMPQVFLSKKVFQAYQKVESARIQPIFFRVKQYASSYTHLFTSRPPPTILMG